MVILYGYQPAVAGEFVNVEPSSPNVSVFLGYISDSDVAGNLFITTIANTSGAGTAGDATQLVENVRKATAGTIDAGEVVYEVGYNVGLDVATVELAQADATGTMPGLGIADGTFSNVLTGHIVTSGRLGGVDTSGFAVADDLYVDPTTPGALTNVKPTDTDLIQKVAIVLLSHATKGVIIVVGAGRSNDIPNFSATDKYWYGDGTGTAVEGDITAFGRSLIDDAAAVNGRATLGLVIGTDVQAHDAQLDDIAALAVTDSNFIVGDGANWVAETGATARTSLGLGTGDSPQFTGIEVGHATDTTVTRASAGDLNVEGNIVYRAGGTDVAVADGGTGSGTAGGARTNLGLVIGTDVQAYDVQLADIAALAVTDSNFIVGDGANWVAETGATARTSLGLAIGTDVQAYDAQLADIAALAVTDSNFIVGDGANWVAETGATARTSLGLGTGDSPQFTGIEVGHATDTTVTRASAGDLNVEGNIVYRAGGTDVAVADGGTGSGTAGGARTNLGLVIGMDVQAYDAQLADIAALAVTDSNFIVGDGANWVAETGATARTSLGLAIGTDVQAYDADLTAYDIGFNAGYTALMAAEDLTVRTYGEMVATRSFSITGEQGYLETQATGSVCIVDVEKNGTTVYATLPQFAISTSTLTAGVLKTDGTEDFTDGDRLTFKVTQIGSTIAGGRMRFTVKGDV